MTIVHMHDIHLRREGKHILKGIDWTVKKSEHWVLYGMNGAGKTALLHTLCAYYFPSHPSGELTVCGHTFGQHRLGDELRKKIGIVSSALQPKVNEEDNSFEIVLSGAFASFGLYEEITDELREKAMRIMTMLGNLDYANRPYAQLSQGERQRALLGRALMAEPELLILDEPASGLDFLAREQLLQLIHEIGGKAHAPTIIYVTHHVEEIIPLFQHMLLLREGEVFEKGKTEQILQDATMSEFFQTAVTVRNEGGRYAIFKEK